MIRVRSILAIALLTIVSIGAGACRASADTSAFRLHVRGHLGSGPALDLDVPWTSDTGGSPFDFTEHACDDIALERLRVVWSALRRLPEGRKVTIETRSESIRASRSAGYLVLEPRHSDDRDDHHSQVLIPDFIVDTILDHDGRLIDRDIERLARARGTITLVKVNSDVGGVTVWMDRSRTDRSD